MRKASRERALSLQLVGTGGSKLEDRERKGVRPSQHVRRPVGVASCMVRSGRYGPLDFTPSRVFSETPSAGPPSRPRPAEPSPGLDPPEESQRERGHPRSLGCCLAWSMSRRLVGYA